MKSTLNTQQTEALQETTKPVLILAGAGSGKTRVITHKIVHLITEHNFHPSQILAVTFTNKAAREMQERVHALLSLKNPNRHIFWISTFHSFCARILRRHIQELGYQSNFSIYDATDQKQLIKEILQNHKIPGPAEKPQQILAMISRAKNRLQSPQALLKEAHSEQNPLTKQIAHIYTHYDATLKKHNCLDFDDLMLKTIDLFKLSKTIELYRKQFQYILVDEFQDSNHAQYTLIKQITQSRRCISVVGDDDQSIYSWRGAEIQNIINFPKDFPDCLTIKLEQNYRSTHTILNAAHSLITHNTRRLHKKLWSENHKGEKLCHFCAQGDKDESHWITQKILSLSKSYTYNNIAILYRMNHQSRIIEEALRRKRIPYTIFGNTEFYSRTEIKDLLSYLIIFSNQHNAIAFKRILQVPKRGIGENTLNKIDALLREQTLSYKDALTHALEHKILHSRAHKQIAQILDWIHTTQKNPPSTITALLDKILKDTHYLKHLQEQHDNYDDRHDNIKELQRAIHEHEIENPTSSLDDFLSQLALQTDIPSETPQETVKLMTLHNSKGLEFDIVFILGLNEGLFPHYRSMNSLQALEEERRLFYVALTRARKQCLLSSASRQFQFGQEQFYPQSSFLKEIDPQYLDHEHEAQPPPFPQKSFKLKQRVIHPQFGEGIVEKILTQSNSPTAEIRFSDKTRIIILKHSNIIIP